MTDESEKVQVGDRVVFDRWYGGWKQRRDTRFVTVTAVSAKTFACVDQRGRRFRLRIDSDYTVLPQPDGDVR